MTAGRMLKMAAPFCTAAILVLAYPAHADDATRPLTIADCPPGYVLGIQDTTEAMPLTHAAPTQADANSYTVAGAMATYQNDPTATSPRQFVTGCVRPAPQNQ